MLEKISNSLLIFTDDFVTPCLEASIGIIILEIINIHHWLTWNERRVTTLETVHLFCFHTTFFIDICLHFTLLIKLDVTQPTKKRAMHKTCVCFYKMWSDRSAPDVHFALELRSSLDEFILFNDFIFLIYCLMGFNRAKLIKLNNKFYAWGRGSPEEIQVKK